MAKDPGHRYLEIKRKLFDRLYGDLNPEQRKAVFSVNGPLLVFAGAGSGKTSVLVRRVAHILRYGNAYESDRVPDGVSGQTLAALEEAVSLSPDELAFLLDGFAEDRPSPRRVLAITFTNKAAGEIKTRLETLLDGEDAFSGLWTGTFHSVCMRMIRSDPGAAGLRDGVTIYDTDDTKKLITAVEADLGIDDRQVGAKYAAAEISRAKEALMSPGDYSAGAVKSPNPRARLCAMIYTEYQRRLTAANAVDFDDIIMKTVLMLRSRDDIRERYAEKFRYICVDEFQDTNPAQLELVKLLGSYHGNVMAVGDDDQSIYGFRGAVVKNILDFENEFRGCRVVKLEQNYRSTQTILDAANAVIAKNSSRYGKSLWTENGSGSKIVLEMCESSDSESRRAAEIVRDGVASGRKYSDFALLYRVNAQSNSLEKAFARSGIPYRICGGQRFNDRKEIKDITSYLQLIANRSDTVRLRRIINEPKRGIGATTVDAVEQIASETGKSMFEVMESADRYTALARSAERLKSFCSVINALDGIYRGGCALDAFIGKVIDMTGYRQMLIEGGEAEADRLDNLEEFVSNAVEYMDSGEEPTLEGFLELNSLVSDVDSYDRDADAAVMMTVHSAKGLEFPVVILPGMEEGIFPSQQTFIDPEELEEERRLAYVALTRAKERVYIIHTSYRMLYGRTMRNQLSRFVADIPGSLIEKKSAETAAFPGSYRAEAREGECGYRPYHGRDGNGYGGYGKDGYGSYGRYGGEGRGSYGDGGYRSVGRLPSSGAPGGIRVVSGTFSAGGRKNAAGSAPREIFGPGDRVEHAAFGAGTVISVKKLGTEAIYEIAFDDVGTKKLMASYAKLKREAEGK